MKKVKKNQLKIVFFSAVKTRCKLHEHVCVMGCWQRRSIIHVVVIMVINYTFCFALLLAMRVNWKRFVRRFVLLAWWYASREMFGEHVYKAKIVYMTVKCKLIMDPKHVLR